MALLGQLARKQIYDDAAKLIDKYPDKCADDLITIIGVRLGLSSQKAREYYHDVIAYRRIFSTEEKTEEDKEDEKAEEYDKQLKKDMKLIFR